MAWLECDKRTGHFKVGFRIGKRKVKKSLETLGPAPRFLPACRVRVPLSSG